MSPRARWVVLAALLLALVVVVVVARPGDEPVRATGVQRLGPEPGEPVGDYLRRAAASLPEGSSSLWALVQLDSYLTAEPAAELARGIRLSRVVFRVPLPRVQTALITRDLPGQRLAAELGQALRSAAQDRLVASQAAPGSRRATVAAAEAAQLRADCACVLALLVFGDGDAVRAVATRPGVRAVHAALPDTRLQDLAISPLLPEQVETAAAVPDDGPVPPAAISLPAPRGAAPRRYANRSRSATAGAFLRRRHGRPHRRPLAPDR